MALEIAPTPAPTARSPLPPLQPPRPGDPDDGDALHAALLEGLGAQPRDAVPDIPPAALAAMRGAARAQLVARLRRDPVFVQAATHHVRALARAAGYGLRADANVVDAWAGQLLPTGCHAPAERAFATAVAAEFGAPWRE